MLHQTYANPAQMETVYIAPLDKTLYGEIIYARSVNHFATRLSRIGVQGHIEVIIPSN